MPEERQSHPAIRLESPSAVSASTGTRVTAATPELPPSAAHERFSCLLFTAVAFLTVVRRHWGPVDTAGVMPRVVSR